MRCCGPAVAVLHQVDCDALGYSVLVSAGGVVLTTKHLFDEGTEYLAELSEGEKPLVKRFSCGNDEFDIAALGVAGRDCVT